MEVEKRVEDRHLDDHDLVRYDLVVVVVVEVVEERVERKKHLLVARVAAILL